MNWRQFVKDNQAMLLSLPGAALWSLPLGVFGWFWIQRYIPTIAFPGQMLQYAFYGGCLLSPVATVCSYEAMMRFGENRNGVHEWLAAFLALFNFVTFFGASQITIFTAMALAGRLLQR